MHFDESYFREEERDGFITSALMKRCWAAQLEVLRQFDRICGKHGIRYYLGYGTLLGAVRSKRFIPWDDDIDIWMLRDDIDRFIRETADDIAAEDLRLVTPFSEDSYHNLVFRLINTHEPRLDREFLERYWLFPFMAGLDLFPLSYIPRDTEKRDTMVTLMACANNLGLNWNDPELERGEKLETYRQLTEILGVEPVDEDRIESHLWQLTDRIGSMYGEEDADEVAAIGYWMENPRRIFHKSWFGEPQYLEFEGERFPCPTDCDRVLRAQFGDDYMTPVMDFDEHDYPYYKTSHRVLMDFFRRNGMESPIIYREL